MELAEPWETDSPSPRGSPADRKSFESTYSYRKPMGIPAGRTSPKPRTLGTSLNPQRRERETVSIREKILPDGEIILDETEERFSPRGDLIERKSIHEDEFPNGEEVITETITREPSINGSRRVPFRESMSGSRGYYERHPPEYTKYQEVSMQGSRRYPSRSDRMRESLNQRTPAGVEKVSIRETITPNGRRIINEKIKEKDRYGDIEEETIQETITPSGRRIIDEKIKEKDRYGDVEEKIIHETITPDGRRTIDEKIKEKDRYGDVEEEIIHEEDGPRSSYRQTRQPQRKYDTLSKSSFSLGRSPYVSFDRIILRNAMDHEQIFEREQLRMDEHHHIHFAVDWRHHGGMFQLHSIPSSSYIEDEVVHGLVFHSSHGHRELSQHKKLFELTDGSREFTVHLSDGQTRDLIIKYSTIALKHKHDGSAEDHVEFFVHFHDVDVRRGDIIFPPQSIAHKIMHGHHYLYAGHAL